MKKLLALTSSTAMFVVANIAAAAADAMGASNKGLGGVADTVRTGFLGPTGDFLLAASFIMGVVSAIVAITVLWKNSRNSHDPNATPMAAVKWGSAAAALLALPIFMGLSVDTFFGDAGKKASIEGGLRSLD